MPSADVLAEALRELMAIAGPYASIEAGRRSRLEHAHAVLTRMIRLTAFRSRQASQGQRFDLPDDSEEPISWPVWVGIIGRAHERDQTDSLRAWQRAWEMYHAAWHALHIPGWIGVMLNGNYVSGEHYLKLFRRDHARWVRKWRLKLRAVNREPVLLPGLGGVDVQVLRPEREEAATAPDVLNSGSSSAAALREIAYRGVAPAPRTLKTRPENSGERAQYDLLDEKNRRSRPRSKQGGRLPVAVIARHAPRAVSDGIMAEIGANPRWLSLFTAYYVEGRTMQEIADARATTKSAVHRTLDDIGRLFAKWGLPLPACPDRSLRVVRQVEAESRH
jgi:hypothetical protein